MTNQFQKRHLPKPCDFCSNMAGYSPIEEMERFGVSIYYCHNCKAEYLYYQSGDRASVSLYAEVNGKMYRWSATSVNTAQLWYVKDPGEPGVRKNENLRPLKCFNADNGDVIPYITPTNVQDKIRIWLPFL